MGVLSSCAGTALKPRDPYASTRIPRTIAVDSAGIFAPSSFLLLLSYDPKLDFANFDDAMNFFMIFSYCSPPVVRPVEMTQIPSLQCRSSVVIQNALNSTERALWRDLGLYPIRISTTVSFPMDFLGSSRRASKSRWKAFSSVSANPGSLTRVALIDITVIARERLLSRV